MPKSAFFWEGIVKLRLALPSIFQQTFNYIIETI